MIEQGVVTDNVLSDLTNDASGKYDVNWLETPWGDQPSEETISLYRRGGRFLFEPLHMNMRTHATMTRELGYIARKAGGPDMIARFCQVFAGGNCPRLHKAFKSWLESSTAKNPQWSMPRK